MAINRAQEGVRSRFALVLRMMNRPVWSWVRNLVALVILTDAIVLAGSLAARSDDGPPSVVSQTSAPPPGSGDVHATVSKGIVKANGITIAYESFGCADHEATLLIMGMGAQLTAWPGELCDESSGRHCSW